MTQLSVKECLSFGWNTFKARPWIFIGASVLLFIVGVIIDIPRSSLKDMPGAGWLALNIVVSIVSIGLSFLITMGKTAFYLKAHDHVSEVELAELWHPHPYWKFLGVSLIAGVLTVLGLLLLIVPGIIVGIMFGFALYIMIDTNCGVKEALKGSVELTKGNRWNIFFLGLAIVGINILGVLALIIGLLVSLPVSTLAVVHAYKTLLSSRAPMVVEPMPAV